MLQAWLLAWCRTMDDGRWPLAAVGMLDKTGDVQYGGIMGGTTPRVWNKPWWQVIHTAHTKTMTTLMMSHTVIIATGFHNDSCVCPMFW